MRYFALYLLIANLTLHSCSSFDSTSNNTQAAPKKNTPAPSTGDSVAAPDRPAITYHFMHKKKWQALKDSFAGAAHVDILNAVNRVDAVHLRRLDSILVPSDFSKPLKDYLPFPAYVDYLKDVNKIILFSYPAQAFAAYEKGQLVLTGPTSMGRKTKPTPQQLYFSNWKAKKTVSTVDSDWILNWNFNVHNSMGVGFHEYALPGYPASHSCMRLQVADAKFLYEWADQWIVKGGTLEANGTPVIVFGQYPFGKTRPWYKLTENPNALVLSADSLKQYIVPHLPQILTAQEKRKTVAG